MFGRDPEITYSTQPNPMGFRELRKEYTAFNQKNYWNFGVGIKGFDKKKYPNFNILDNDYVSVIGMMYRNDNDSKGDQFYDYKLEKCS